MEEVRKIFEIIEDMCLNGNCTYCTFRSNEGGCMFKDAVGCNPEKFISGIWIEFRNHMEQLHEMQDEGCRGCERPETDCRKCMQDYYWDNIHYYLTEK